MKALVINAGSSSLKCSVFSGSKLQKHYLFEEIASFEEAFSKLLEHITIEHFDFIAHRVVHGGDSFIKPTKITKENLKKLKKLSPLAPLHNPHNIKAIEYFLEHYPTLAQIAVFDTAFFSTLEKEAYLYAIDPKFYNKHHIRRYGFHGSSHSYLLKKSAKLLQKDPSKTSLISLHLGNGASVCAIENGKAVDISMGFTPLEGLVMGSRCGDIDAGVVLYLQRVLGLEVAEIDALLNKKSGLIALCGTNDMRVIEQNKEQEPYKTALQIYVRRIVKYIGSYLALLNRCDAIVFSGGVGEHSAWVRKMVCQNLEKFGILQDFEANKKNCTTISKEESSIKLFVIPTNEELEIFEVAKGVFDGE